MRGLLGGSLLAGTLIGGGGGRCVGVTPAGAAAPVGTSTTCRAPSTRRPPAQAASTTGVTNKSVTVGNVSIISGPVPGLFEGAPIGVKAYFAYINSKGGVNGRKLLVDSKDDAFSGQQNETETQEAVGQRLRHGRELLALRRLRLQAAGRRSGRARRLGDPRPDHQCAAQRLQRPAPAVGRSLGPLTYYKKHFPKDMNVGTIVSNVASALAQWAGRGGRPRARGLQDRLRATTSTRRASDFTTDVINMRNDHVNAVDLTALDWQVGADFVQNAAAQGWHPGLIFSGGPIYADQFIAHAGGPAATNGIQIGQVQALYLGQDAKNLPADKLFLKYVQKVMPSWTPDLFTLYGWASAQLFVQALQAAGPNPTRGSVLAQLKKITSFDAERPLGAGQSGPEEAGQLLCDAPDQERTSTCGRSPPSRRFSCNTTYFYASGGLGS